MVNDIHGLLSLNDRRFRRISGESLDYRIRYKVLDKNGKSVDNIMNVNRFSWLECILRMTNHRIPR